MSTSIDAIGLDIAKMFYTTLDSIITRGEDLSKRIEDISQVSTEGVSGTDGTKSSISQEEMLVIQFEIGQYNAMVEMLSSISKSLTDMMKTLAQRSS
ncbi:EscF/YscF/HrpA family type III secretion system needle major subunit [Mailhella sp.]